MLEDMIRTVTHKVIAQDYAFLKAPAVLYAVVTKVTQLGETFSYDDLVIYNDDTGTCFRGHIVAHWYEYTLQAVDRWGNVDSSYPPFPDIRSRIQLEPGAFVSVAMAYGDVPAIIREVKL